MRSHLRLPLAVLLSNMAALANAGTISSPPVVSFWGATQDACYLRNVGASPVSVSVQISGEDGVAVTPQFQNCNDAPLAPGTTCLVLADRPVTGFTACSATTPGSTKNLRGTMEARFNFQIVSAQDLR